MRNKTPEFLLISARQQARLCRIAYGASGHRATVRSKVIEADYLQYMGD
jgi:hypothetical protein